MKKTVKNILSITLFSCIGLSNLQSQSKEHPKEFKFVKTEKPSNKLLGWESIMNNYVVIPCDGTVEQNYNDILDFIKVTFNNPEEVVDVKSENKFIRLNGFAPNLYYVSTLPLISETYDVKYSMTINVKDNRIKVDVNSMEYLTIETDYEYPKRYKDITEVPDKLLKEVKIKKWNPLNKIYLHKSSGKPKKRVFGKTDVKIENYFNGLITMFLKYKKTIGKNSDW